MQWLSASNASDRSDRNVQLPDTSTGVSTMAEWVVPVIAISIFFAVMILASRWPPRHG